MTGTQLRTSQSLGSAHPFVPPFLNKLEDTGLSALWLQDLALKILYFQGVLSGFKVAEELSLPFVGVTDVILDGIKREKLVEIKSSSVGLGEGSYLYAITGAGVDRAREALDRNQYAGPAPVPIAAYNKAIIRQSTHRVAVSESGMQQILSDLVLASSTVDQLGPALNSGSSIFLYGPTGNGKTSVARAFGQMVMSQDMYIPYALFVDGQVIKLYDSVNHELVPEDNSNNLKYENSRQNQKWDARWIHIRRPFIVVGGELTLAGLDLVYNDNFKFYEAPFQVKANGGILLIDDFGRQLVRPRDLLNRWIVPLESRVDFLTLHTGRKIEIPFDVLVVFSTNIPPRDLVDEAFLRRLRHKIEIGDPTFDEYRLIFQRVAENRKIPYNDQALAYLLEQWYIKPNRKLRASHPRDLCDQLLDIARYRGTDPAMTNELMDLAAHSYFVDF